MWLQLFEQQSELLWRPFFDCYRTLLTRTQILGSPHSECLRVPNRTERRAHSFQQNLFSNSCLKTADCSSYFGTKTTVEARSQIKLNQRVIKRNPLPQTGFFIWSKQHWRKQRASCLVHHKQDWNICWPKRFKTIVLCYFHDSRQEIW